MFVISEYPSNKGDVCLIWINTMLTFDKVKTKLFCPRWLPRSCHDGRLMLQKLIQKSKRGVHRLKRACLDRGARTGGQTWIRGACMRSLEGGEAHTGSGR
jgi:hypothetical protein